LGISHVKRFIIYSILIYSILADLIVTATQYDDTISSNVHNGYKIDYLNSALGTEVGPEEFSEQNGVAFMFRFTTSDISMKVTVSSRLTQLQLASQVLGTLAGLMGAIRVAMAIVEKCETKIRAHFNLKKSKDDAHFDEFAATWQYARRQTLIKGGNRSSQEMVTLHDANV